MFDKIKGSARFATPDECKDKVKIASIQDAIGPILGQTINSRHGEKCIVKKAGKPNDNILVIAPSGSESATSFAKNAAYQTVRQAQSIVISDPMGKLYKDLRSLFTSRGYVVKALNLTDFKASNTWNCFNAIRKNNLVESVGIMVDAIIGNCKGDDNAELHDIYTNGEKLLLQALILRVYLGTDYGPDEKNIRSVHMLAISDDIEQKMNDKSCATNDREFNLWFSPWQKIKANATGNLWGNIFTSLLADLGVLGDDNVSAVMSDNDIDLTLPGNQPCAYFLITPAQNDTYRFVSALFLTNLIDSLIGEATDQFASARGFSKNTETVIENAARSPEPALQMRVNFMLDGFENIGIIPGFPSTISVSRAYNISFWMVVQTVGRLEKMYENSWETILANCDAHIFLGSRDENTCKYFSRLIGSTSCKKISFIVRYNKNGTEVVKPIMSAAELCMLPSDRCVILMSCKNAIMAKTVSSECHPLSKEEA